MAPPVINPQNRFWIHVSPRGECWEWMGGVDRSGYGVIGRPGAASGAWKAHRFSWESVIGEIPAGLCVLHRCDNRRCVRPDHLFLGTKGDNARDASAKGRTLHGERSPNAKLTNAQAVMVCNLCACGIPQRVIADIVHVSQVAVSLIHRRRTYARAEADSGEN